MTDAEGSVDLECAGLPLTSHNFGMILDRWVMCHWDQEVQRLHNQPLADQLEALEVYRATAIRAREAGRQSVIRQLREHGWPVGDDFGLPRRCLTLASAEVAGSA